MAGTGWFTVNGARFDFVATGDWTFREARRAKQVSGGMSVAAVERGIADADPDAMMAAMVVSMERASGPGTVKPDSLLDGKVVLMLEELGQSLEDEEAEMPPPPVAAAPDPGMTAEIPASAGIPA